jgi:hypothetical protein
MATKRITTADKVGLVAKKVHENQFWDDDYNEIKDVENNNADEIDINAANILSTQSGYQGELLIADTPTIDGYYLAGESGTYINAGSLVIDLTEGVNYINVSGTQTVFTKTVIPVDVVPTGSVAKDEILAVSGGDIFNSISVRTLTNPKGGNYLNQEVLIDGWVNNVGVIIPSANVSRTDFLPINDGETLVSNTTVGGGPQIALYDEDFVFISSVDATVQQITGTSSSKYAVWSVPTNTLTETSAIYSEALPVTPFGIEPFNPIWSYTERLQRFDEVNEVLLNSRYNTKEDMTLVSTSYAVGIFEDAGQTTFHTSDFIEIIANSDLNYYISFGDTMNSSFTLMRFYDKDQVEIKRVRGNSTERPKTANLLYQIDFIAATKYIKYATKIDQPDTGLHSAPSKTLEEVIKPSLGEVLWLGTSIPAGASYPTNACKNIGYEVINKAQAASFLTFDPTPPAIIDIVPSSGLSLCATVAEKETKWRALVTSGDVSEAQLDLWKDASYENLVLPYLDQIEMVVIDHGYNDKDIMPALVAAGQENVVWTSRDRTTWEGAFGWITDEIIRRKHFMKILVGGYFQNEVEDIGDRFGRSVCTVIEWTANKYDFPLLDTWNYAGMGDYYIPDSSTYIADFNVTYGTTHNENWFTDGNGNILAYQLYSPDTVHPHSDLTGNSNKRLDAIFTKLLRDSTIQ